MICRILFREYHATTNIVSTSGTAVTGSGTKFNTYVSADDWLEIDGVGIYQVDSVTNDTALVLKTSAGTNSNKKWWVDWSNWQIVSPNLARMVESENPGEAGIVVFDNISLEMVYIDVVDGKENPVYNAFNQNLDSVLRFEIKLKIAKDVKSDWANEYTIFYGAIDFSSLKYPSIKDSTGLITNQISFTVLDRISAISFLDNSQRQRVDWIDIFGRISGESYGGTPFIWNSIDSLASNATRTDNPFKQRIFLIQTWSNDNPDTHISHDWNKISTITISTLTTPDTSTVRITTSSSHNLAVGDVVHIIGGSGSISTLINHANICVNKINSSTQFEALWPNAGESGTGGTIEEMNDSDAVVKRGESFTTPHVSTDPHDEELVWFVQDSGILRFTSGVFSGYSTWVKVAPNLDAIEHSYLEIHGNIWYTTGAYYDESVGFIDITGTDTSFHTNPGRDIVTAFDGLKILEGVLRSQWAGSSLINRIFDSSGDPITAYSMPVEYANKLVTNLPFNKDPLDAIAFIANSTLSYLYFNEDGDFVVQNRESINWATDAGKGWQGGSARTIDDYLIGDVDRSYFWDKLVDAVEISVNSFVKSYGSGGEWDGTYLDGLGLAYTFTGSKARNKLVKEIIVDNDKLNALGYEIAGGLLQEIGGGGSMTEAEILNDYGDNIAGQYIDFYGKRHESFAVSMVDFIWAMREWSLLDVWTFNSLSCFSTRIEFDIEGAVVNIELVEITGHTYTQNTVVIQKQLDGYISGGRDVELTGNYTVTGGSGTTGHYWSGSPLHLDAAWGRSSLDLDTYYLSASALDAWIGSTNITTLNTITTGTWNADVIMPDYGGTGIANAVSSTITLGGSFAMIGAYTFAGTLSGNTAVTFPTSGTLLTDAYTRTGTAPIEIAGDHSPHNIGQNLIYSLAITTPLKLTGNNLDLGYDTPLVLSGSNLALDITATIPIYVNGGKLDFRYVTSPANLKYTAGELDTIQPIHTTATPQFLRLGLGVAADGSVTYFQNQQTDASTSEYTTGWTGVGWGHKWASGEGYTIETDNMFIRGSLTVYELIINQIRATNGTLIVSSAGRVDFAADPGEIYDVDITFEDPTGHDLLPFAVGDILLMQRVNISGSDVVKKIAVEVKAIASPTSLLRADCDYLYNPAVAEPASGDTFVRIGSTSDGDREGVVYLTADDNEAPFIDIVDGIQSWSDWTDEAKTKVRLGKLDGITDSFFGSIPAGTYGLYARGDSYLTGKIYAQAGGWIAGWDINANAITSPLITEGSTTYQFELYADNSPVKIGAYLFIDKPPNGGDDRLSFGAVIDGAGTLQTGMYGIAYYLGTSAYFQLTNTVKQIANWTFDTVKFSNSGVALDTTSTVRGLSVTKTIGSYGSQVQVLVGDNTEVPPVLDIDDTADQLTNADFDGGSGSWTVTGSTPTKTFVSGRFQWDRQTIDSTGTVYESHLWQLLANEADLVDQQGYLQFDLRKFQDAGSDTDYKLRVILYVNGFGDLIDEWMDISELEEFDTWYTFRFPYDGTGLSAGAGQISFMAQTIKNSGSTNYNALWLDNIEIHVYNQDDTFSYLNTNGLVIHKNPLNKVEFTTTLGKIDIDKLRIGGKRPMRFRGFGLVAPLSDNQAGDFFYFYDTQVLKIFDGVSYVTIVSGSGGDPDQDTWKQIFADSGSANPILPNQDFHLYGKTNGGILTQNATEVETDDAIKFYLQLNNLADTYTTVNDADVFAFHRVTSVVDTYKITFANLKTSLGTANWDTAYDNMITALDFNTTNGELKLTQQDSGTIIKDLDGRYLIGTDTDDLPEGVSNLYFTDERVDDRVNALMTNSQQIIWTYNDVGNSLEADLASSAISDQADIGGALINTDGLFVSDTTNGLRKMDITRIQTYMQNNLSFGSGEPDQNLFVSIITDSGTATAVTTTDTVDLLGGEGIDTSETGNVITISIDTEKIEDIVGAMVTGNVTAGIDVTYQDATSKIDFTIDLNELTTISPLVNDHKFVIVDSSGGSKNVTITTLGNYLSGLGLTHTSGVLALDINSLTSKSPVGQFDYLLWYDVDGGSGTYHNKIRFDDLLIGVAGDALVQSAGELNVVINSLTALGQAIGDANEFMIYDTVLGIRKVAASDIETYIQGNLLASIDIIAGVGLSGGGAIDSDATLTLDLDELGEETSIVDADFVAMIDTTDSGSQKISFANFKTALNLDTEGIQDIVGAMVQGGSVQTLIAVTYDDTNGELDFVVDDNLASYDNSNSVFFDSAGAGLTNTGSVIDVVGTADRITVNANDIDIASTYAGQGTIVTVGELSSGSILWAGDIETSGDIDLTGTGKYNIEGTIVINDLREAIFTKATVDNIIIDTNTISTSTGNLAIDPAGDIVFNPTGNDILPFNNFDLNLGSEAKRYLSLHVAELWVNTLVSQDVIATTGGRIMVAPSSQLQVDINATATTITVKYNNFRNGDIVYLEKSGQLEFMAIASVASANGSNWDYTVVRAKEGDSINGEAWVQGDAIVSTGNVGDGFIDLYSHYGFRQDIFSYVYNYDESVNGSNSVTNGDFLNWTGDDPDNWTVVGTETGDVYINENSSRAEIFSDTGEPIYMYQDVGLKVGQTYRVTFDIDINSDDTGFYVQIGSGGTKNRFTGTGAKSVESLCTGDENLYVGTDDTCAVVIDDFTCALVGDYSINYADDPDFTLFPAVQAVKDCMYFGKPGQFRQITFDIGTAAVYTSATFIWEFWNGTAWTAFTPTTSPDWENTGIEVCEFSGVTMTGWTECYGGDTVDAFAYWVRVRISAINTWTVDPITQSIIFSDTYKTGPTIVGNVRNTTTFNDWDERWAIGNLNGLYGYGVDTYGSAFGKYSNSSSFLTIDETNGIVISYRANDENSQKFKVDMSGIVIVGDPTFENVRITDTSLEFRYNTNVYVSLVGDRVSSIPTLTLGSISKNNVVINDTSLTFKNGATALGSLTGTEWVLGNISTEYIRITSTAVEFRDTPDVAYGWDFQVGWTTVAGATISDADTFITPASDGGIKKLYLIAGTAYSCTVAGTTSANDIEIRNSADAVLYWENAGTGAFSDTFNFTATTDGYLYLKNIGAGTTDFTTLTISKTIPSVVGSIGTNAWTIGMDEINSSRITIDSVNGLRLISKDSAGSDSMGVTLAIDGSGSLATGDISWNTSGSFSISGSVAVGSTLTLDGSGTGIITGGTIRTAASGERIELVSPSLSFFVAGGNEAKITAYDGGGGLVGLYMQSNATAGTVRSELVMGNIGYMLSKFEASASYSKQVRFVYGSTYATLKYIQVWDSDISWEYFFVDDSRTYIGGYMTIAKAGSAKTTLEITSTGTDVGITIGGDTNLYRSAANILMTDDNFQIGSGYPSTKLYFGDTDTYWYAYAVNQIGTGDRVNFSSAITNPVTASYGVTFGGTVAETPDTNLYRSAENVLKTDDAFVATVSLQTSGQVKMDAGTTDADGLIWGTDVHLFRSAANKLKTTDEFLIEIDGGKDALVLGTGSFDVDVGITFGGASGDTNLYRSGANKLKTDDDFYCAGLFASNTTFNIQNTVTDGSLNFKCDDTGSINFNYAITSSPGVSFYDNTTLKLKVFDNIYMNLPTSASGLTAGELWNDSGTVKIV